jgi:hypothetical protein
MHRDCGRTVCNYDLSLLKSFCHYRKLTCVHAQCLYKLPHQVICYGLLFPSRTYYCRKRRGNKYWNEPSCFPPIVYLQYFSPPKSSQREANQFDPDEVSTREMVHPVVRAPPGPRHSYIAVTSHKRICGVFIAASPVLDLAAWLRTDINDMNRKIAYPSSIKSDKGMFRIDIAICRAIR